MTLASSAGFFFVKVGILERKIVVIIPVIMATTELPLHPKKEVVVV